LNQFATGFIFRRKAMQLRDQAAIFTGGASGLDGEVVRLDASLRMSPR
jgi:hypothetical protein